MYKECFMMSKKIDEEFFLQISILKSLFLLLVVKSILPKKMFSILLYFLNKKYRFLLIIDKLIRVIYIVAKCYVIIYHTIYHNNLTDLPVLT